MTKTLLGSMTSPLISADHNSKTDLDEIHGRVAQWIRHLTTNQGIPGSSPGMVESFENILMLESFEWSHFNRTIVSGFLFS